MKNPTNVKEVFIKLPAQVTPSPLKPAGHAQVNDPILFVHVALGSQLLVSLIHSSISKKKIFEFFILKLDMFIFYNYPYSTTYRNK